MLKEDGGASETMEINHVERAPGREIAENGCLSGNPLDVLHRETHIGLMGKGEDMKGCVG